MKMNNIEAWGTTESYFDDVVLCLSKLMEINVITELYEGNTCMLDIKIPKDNTTQSNHTYFITDNGGEFTVKAINMNIHYNVPYTGHGFALHPYHVAEMIKQSLKGDVVYYCQPMSTDDMNYLLNGFKGMLK